MTTEKQNCWEFMNCGREPGGKLSGKLETCPAAMDYLHTGANLGKNGGRICWNISGTLCFGTIQGTFAQKRDTCFSCSFFKQVREEEREKFLLDAQNMPG